jgi:hypothetical protein
VNFTHPGSLAKVPDARNGSSGKTISFFQYGDGGISPAYDNAAGASKSHNTAKNTAAFLPVLIYHHTKIV